MKKDKNKYKSFEVETIQDALIVLGNMIADSIFNLDKYFDYSIEARDLYISHIDDQYIPADV